MALKAGYIGVKKSMLGLINSIASAKIIKTIGNGLKLTSAGTLSADIDTETMEFKNGKLAAKATALDYSTTEQNTGVKWTDGKTIYRKTYNIGDATGTKQLIDTLGSDVSDIINFYGSWNYQLSLQNEYRPLPHFASSSTMVYPIIDKADSNKLYMIIATQASTKDMKLTIEYTKTESQEG